MPSLASRLLGAVRRVVGLDARDAARTARIAASPDRVMLVTEILPRFAIHGGAVLWVGVRAYTAGYPAILEANGARCWTTDIARKVERYGARGRHRSGDVCDAASIFAGQAFDAVLLNGVLGYGVDGPERQVRAIEGLASLMKPRGLFLHGWNEGRIEPEAAAAFDRLFEPTELDGLPASIAVPGTDHRYAILRKR